MESDLSKMIRATIAICLSLSGAFDSQASMINYEIGWVVVAVCYSLAWFVIAKSEVKRDKILLIILFFLILPFIEMTFRVLLGIRLF